MGRVAYTRAQSTCFPHARYFSSLSFVYPSIPPLMYVRTTHLMQAMYIESYYFPLSLHRQPPPGQVLFSSKSRHTVTSPKNPPRPPVQTAAAVTPPVVPKRTSTLAIAQVNGATKQWVESTPSMLFCCVYHIAVLHIILIAVLRISL